MQEPQFDFDAQSIAEADPSRQFQMFCMLLERGFAMHTGHSERLIVDYRLDDGGAKSYIPRVKPKRGVNFRVPESWLKSSHLFLFYEPSSGTKMPELVSYDTQTDGFVPYNFSQDDYFDRLLSSQSDLPVLKLSTLRGLHYIKDTICLQMFLLNFKRLNSADPKLADQIRQLLVRKLRRFVEYTLPWIHADHSESVAKEYLQAHGNARHEPQPDFHSDDAASQDRPFLSWD